MDKLSLVALLMALFTARAFADEPPASDPTPPSKVFGGILLGVSSVAAVSASVTGGLSVADLPLCVDCGNGNDTNHGIGTLGDAAIGLAVVAAVTAAIGIPLVVAASNDARKKMPVRFSLAPTLGSSGGGMQASLAVHF